jgi:hypothetical protein
MLCITHTITHLQHKVTNDIICQKPWMHNVLWTTIGQLLTNFSSIFIIPTPINVAIQKLIEMDTSEKVKTLPQLLELHILCNVLSNQSLLIEIKLKVIYA